MAASTVANDAIPALPPWSCNKALPAQPFGSQKEAFGTAKKYANNQGFAVRILRSYLRGDYARYL